MQYNRFAGLRAPSTPHVSALRRRSLALSTCLTGASALLLLGAGAAQAAAPATEPTAAGGLARTFASPVAVAAPDRVGDLTTVSPLAVIAIVEDGDDVVVEVGDLETTADGEAAIDTTASGTTTISAGDLTTSGANAQGVTAEGVDDITIVVGNVTTTGDRSDGVAANNNVGGESGAITITAGDVATSGEASTGIRASAYQGGVTIDAGRITTTGFGADAVYATSYATGVTIVVDSVETSGTGGRGVTAYSGGTVTITAGDVTTTGAGEGPFLDAGAIKAVGAAVHVDVGTVSTAGDYSTGIYANSNFVYDNGQDERDITIAAEGVATTGFSSDGVHAINTGFRGATAVDVATVTTSGDFSNGVFAYSQSGLTSVNAGAIETEGTQSVGIVAATREGNITVSAGSIVTSGEMADGIYAYNGGPDAYGFGATTVEAGSVATSGDNAFGVYTVGFGTRVDTEVSIGSVATTGEAAVGIRSVAVGSGNDITITGDTISTAGDFATGVEAVNYSVGGDIVLEVEDILTNGYIATGAFAFSVTGDIAMSFGSIVTHGEASFGVSAGTDYGDLQLDVGSVVTTGLSSTGMFVNGKHVDLLVGTIVTTGDGAFGLSTEAADETLVRVGTVTTSGRDAWGVDVSGAQTTLVVDQVTTTGRSSQGIAGDSSDDDGFIDITITKGVSVQGGEASAIGVQAFNDITIRNLGLITTGGRYSDAVVTFTKGGDITITGPGSISTQGIGSDGVFSYTTGGDIRVSQASITTSGDFAMGVYAASLVPFYTGQTLISDNTLAIEVGTIRTLGANAAGVRTLAQTEGTDIVITSNTVSTAGEYSVGLLATTYSGDVNVRVQSLTTSGDHADGIVALSRSGAVTVEAGTVSVAGAEATAILTEGATVAVKAGTVTSRDANAVVMTAIDQARLDVLGRVHGGDAGAWIIAPDARATIARGASLSGDVDGLVVDLAAPAAPSLLAAPVATIDNAGSLAGGTGDALRVTGGSAVITNSGVLRGSVELDGFDDILTNSGVFNVTRDSDFGGGADRLVNSGRLVVGDGKTVAMVALRGLETFTNDGGLIDLRNGLAGDSLTLTGSFSGSGASGVGLDLGAGGASDHLVIAGAATGSTTVSLNVKPADATLLAAPVALISVGTGSAANAFTLDDADIGLVRYGLRFDATTGQVLLEAQAGGAVERMLGASEALRTLADQSSSALSSNLGRVRDAGGDGSRAAWIEVHGQTRDRDASGRIAIGGSPADLGYSQDSQGVQMGVEFGSIKSGFGPIRLGVTGGYGTSDLDFNDDGQTAGLEALNLGGYAVLTHGRAFANAMIRYDHFSIDTEDRLGGWSVDADADGWAAQVEAGARYAIGRFFIEPTAALAWGRTARDDVQVLGQGLAFEDATSITSTIGARAGGVVQLSGGQSIAYVSRLNWVHEFDGDSRLTFLSGGLNESLEGAAITDRGQLGLGAELRTGGPIDAWIEAEADLGDGVDGGGLRIGARYRF